MKLCIVANHKYLLAIEIFSQCIPNVECHLNELSTWFCSLSQITNSCQLCTSLVLFVFDLSVPNQRCIYSFTMNKTLL